MIPCWGRSWLILKPCSVWLWVVSLSEPWLYLHVVFSTETCVKVSVLRLTLTTHWSVFSMFWCVCNQPWSFSLAPNFLKDCFYCSSTFSHHVSCPLTLFSYSPKIKGMPWKARSLPKCQINTLFCCLTAFYCRLFCWEIVWSLRRLWKYPSLSKVQEDIFKRQILSNHQTEIQHIRSTIT